MLTIFDIPNSRIFRFLDFQKFYTSRNLSNFSVMKYRSCMTQLFALISLQCRLFRNMCNFGQNKVRSNGPIFMQTIPSLLCCQRYLHTILYSAFNLSFSQFLCSFVMKSIASGMVSSQERNFALFFIYLSRGVKHSPFHAI